MEIKPELLQLLSQAGHMACFRGLVEQGQVIMEGVHAVRPHAVPVLVNLAIVRLAAERYAETIEILRDQVLVAEPDHMTAKCFLGIALMQSGQLQQGRALLQEVREHGNDDERSIAEAHL